MTRNINPFLTFYNTYSRLSDAKIIENLYCGISMGFSPSLSFGSVLADHQVVYCSPRRNSDGSRTELRIESCHTHTHKTLVLGHPWSKYWFVFFFTEVLLAKDTRFSCSLSNFAGCFEFSCVVIPKEKCVIFKLFLLR